MHPLKNSVLFLVAVSVMGFISFSAGKEDLAIRRGEISLEVERIDETVHAIRELVQQEGGSVSHFEIDEGPEELKSGSIVFRVPAERLDALFLKVRKLGRVVSGKNTLEDHGEEMARLDVKLENARLLEQRLQDVLKTRTQSIKDILEVERELTRVREQVEELEGHKRHLKDTCALSTIEAKIKTAAIGVERANKKTSSSKIRPVALRTSTRPAAGSIKPPANSGSYSVQIAAFKQQTLAEAAVNKLVAKGYEVYIDPPSNGSPYYRVKVGKFKSHTEAEEATQRLRRDGFQTMIKGE